jgi:hypothetical protein
MDIFRISSQHRINMRYWSFCGDDYDYNLFKDKKPKEVAINIIRQVFNGQNLDNMQFAYKLFFYRGKNNLQDRIDVYYRIK